MMAGHSSRQFKEKIMAKIKISKHQLTLMAILKHGNLMLTQQITRQ